MTRDRTIFAKVNPKIVPVKALLLLLLDVNRPVKNMARVSIMKKTKLIQENN